jgi:hypothetical protein
VTEIIKAEPFVGTLPRHDEQGFETGTWFWVSTKAWREATALRRTDHGDVIPQPEEVETDDLDDLDLELEEAGDEEPEDEGEPEEPEEDEKPDYRWLGCIVHVGTNYVEVEGYAGDEHGSHHCVRVHDEDFDKVCTPAENATTYIEGKVTEHNANAQALMKKVADLTRRLGVAPRAAIADGGSGETQALAVRGSGSDQSIAEYKQALIKAKTDELPALFKAIERQNKISAGWMTAQLIPWKAKAAGLQPVIKAIENRIFSVELYAGLKEQVVQISDGNAAHVGEKIALMQRRCYMDEETLARYEAGGMDFREIEKFDAWLARPENRDRIMPRPRCIVAFRVRRYRKEEEEAFDLRDFIRLIYEHEANMQTFLYLRNGDKLYRLSTAIDFGAELFPDMDRLDSTQRFYIKAGTGWRDKEYVITEGLYRTWKAEDEAHEASVRKKGDRTYCACTDEEIRKYGRKQSMLWCRYRSKSDGYELYSPDSVYYDDATAYLKEEQDRHNRLVLVLQGLLDRSPVFHPHPPWKLWQPDGFMAGLELIYDSARAITPGEAPDFEAYRERLNASIQVGSVTVGQDDAWQEREAARENARQARDWRIRNKSNYRHFRPDDNPGPGTLAKVAASSKQGPTYRWTRKKKTGRKTWVENPERPGWGWNRTVYDDMPDSITVPVSRVLNVDAYTPGDYRIFFDDPRTRGDYIKWAPLLLIAEDYHAGKRKVNARKSDSKCRGSSHTWPNGKAKDGDYCDCGDTKWED